jgi:magnesium chelatase accessory protein
MSALRWDIEGKTWPFSEASRFVEADNIVWHVQTMGQGPDLLLLHGTGASTHSWRRIFPILASHFRVIACDLPGHGFTKAPSSFRYTLPGMAGAVASLARALGVTLDFAVGHSAGAAILCRMALDKLAPLSAIVSLNGALLPFGGAASQIFPTLAKILFLNPFVPSFLAWRAHNRSVVKGLIEGTGSKLDPEGLDFYARLFQSPIHVQAALSMMANWDLPALAQDLPKLTARLTLITGSLDAAIPPSVAFKVAELVPDSRVVLLRGLGHLAHEENPQLIAQEIFSSAAEKGLLDNLGLTAPPPPA